MSASNFCLIGLAAIGVPPVGCAVSVPDYASGGRLKRSKKTEPPYTDRFPHRGA